MVQLKTSTLAAALMIVAVACLSGPTRAQCIPDQFPESWLLQQEEAGGHTIARHVGSTDFQLLEALAHNPNIPFEGSYPASRPPAPVYETAQAMITAVLGAQQAETNNWARSATAGARRTLNFVVAEIVGRVAVRNPDRIINTNNFSVIFEATGSGRCFVLTSFPRPPD